ncbi:hypothetical protein T484DRAFT_1758441, partial [Baffinella frigidus]
MTRGPNPNPPPTNWMDHLDAETRTLEWKNAAGLFEEDGVTYKKAAAHSKFRGRVWNLERARLANEKPANERNAKERDDILKVDHPREHTRLHEGGVGGKEIIPPPAGWRNDLDEDERTEFWKFASGLNIDGTSKTPAAHSLARADIIWKDKVDAAKKTSPSKRTIPENDILREDEERRAKKAELDKAVYIIWKDKVDAAKQTNP